MKTKVTCQCAVCGEQFSNITDHMLHYMRTHDEGFKEHGQRRRRGIACRGCAKQLAANVFECVACGWKETKIKEEQL
jgi:hypothetical protein